MIDTIKVAISAIVGGVITGVFGVWLQRVKNQGSNEGIYAEHIDGALDRLEERTKERDDLKNQVMQLQLQIKQQSLLIEKQNKVINSLNKQVGDLNSKFDRLNKMEEGK